MRGLTFIKIVLYVMGVTYLFAISFTLLFAGTGHPVDICAAFSVPLEYLMAGSIALFCAGILGLQVGDAGRVTMSAALLAGSVIIALVGFAFFWRQTEGYLGVVLMVVILVVLTGVSFLGASLKVCHSRESGNP